MSSKADGEVFDRADATSAVCDQRTEHLLSCIQPEPTSELHRLTISAYVCNIIRKCFQPRRKVEVFLFGSVPLRTYLPDGDVDISIFALPDGPKDNIKDMWANKLLKSLEWEQARPTAPYRIRNCQVIQAEVKLVKCVVADVVVDVSFNTLGGLCAVAFLEWVDRQVGRDHLFKRSIVLVKAWCYYEGRLLGSHHGLISSYALEAMVLYVVNLYGVGLQTPLQVLQRFFQVFAAFDWDKYCLSLLGPIPLDTFPEPYIDRSAMPEGEPLFNEEALRYAVQEYSVQPAAASAILESLLLNKDKVVEDKNKNGNNNIIAPAVLETVNPSLEGLESQPEPQPVQLSFPLKHFNIMDPLQPNNNIGRSVSKASYSRIHKALSFASQRLDAILRKDPMSAGEKLDHFFRNTWRCHAPLAASPTIEYVAGTMFNPAPTATTALTPSTSEAVTPCTSPPGPLGVSADVVKGLPKVEVPLKMAVPQISTSSSSTSGTGGGAPMQTFVSLVPASMVVPNGSGRTNTGPQQQQQQQQQQHLLEHGLPRRHSSNSLPDVLLNNNINNPTHPLTSGIAYAHHPSHLTSNQQQTPGAVAMPPGPTGMWLPVPFDAPPHQVPQHPQYSRLPPGAMQQAYPMMPTGAFVSPRVLPMAGIPSGLQAGGGPVPHLHPSGMQQRPMRPGPPPPPFIYPQQQLSPQHSRSASIENTHTMHSMMPFGPGPLPQQQQQSRSQPMSPILPRSPPGVGLVDGSSVRLPIVPPPIQGPSSARSSKSEPDTANLLPPPAAGTVTVSGASTPTFLTNHLHQRWLASLEPLETATSLDPAMPSAAQKPPPSKGGSKKGGGKSHKQQSLNKDVIGSKEGGIKSTWSADLEVLSKNLAEARRCFVKREQHQQQVLAKAAAAAKDKENLKAKDAAAATAAAAAKSDASSSTAVDAAAAASSSGSGHEAPQPGAKGFKAQESKLKRDDSLVDVAAKDTTEEVKELNPLTTETITSAAAAAAAVEGTMNSSSSPPENGALATVPAAAATTTTKAPHPGKHHQQQQPVTTTAPPGSFAAIAAGSTTSMSNKKPPIATSTSAQPTVAEIVAGTASSRRQSLEQQQQQQQRRSLERRPSIDIQQQQQQRRMSLERRPSVDGSQRASMESRRSTDLAEAVRASLPSLRVLSSGPPSYAMAAASPRALSTPSMGGIHSMSTTPHNGTASQGPPPVSPLRTIGTLSSRAQQAQAQQRQQVNVAMSSVSTASTPTAWGRTGGPQGHSSQQQQQPVSSESPFSATTTTTAAAGGGSGSWSAIASQPRKALPPTPRSSTSVEGSNKGKKAGSTGGKSNASSRAVSPRAKGTTNINPSKGVVAPAGSSPRDEQFMLESVEFPSLGG